MINDRRREFLKIIGLLALGFIFSKILKEREEVKEKIVVKEGEIIIE